MFNDEVRDLPDHAGAAMSYRAIARMLDILPHTGAEPWPPDATSLMNRVIERLEHIARTTELGENAYVLGQEGFNECQSVLAQFEGGTYNRFGWLCIYYAMTVSGSGGQSACGACKGLVWNITPKTESRIATRIVENANWDDFKQIRLAYEAGELTADTPLPPDDLGPLWPKGPHDWGSFKWKHLEAEKAASEKAYQEHQERGRKIIEGLVPRSDALSTDVRDAIDRITPSDHDRYRHAFIALGDKVSGKWPGSLEKPTTSVTQQLHDFYLVHAWGGFFIPKGEPMAPLWMISPDAMSVQKKCMLEWDSALDCFDPEAVEDANRYAKSIGSEPNAKLAPCSKRDLLVFAQVHESPDAFFVVTKGSAAGMIYFFDHETGIDFDTPVADSLAGWIDTIADPNSEFSWHWLEDDDED